MTFHHPSCLKTFKEIVVIGQTSWFHDGVFDYKRLEYTEVISIITDSIVLNDPVIPPLPKELAALGGTQLPNGDLLLCGGIFVEEFEDQSSDESEDFPDCSDEYLSYKSGSSQWTKVGTMKKKRYGHSSVLIEDRLHTIGGFYNTKITSRHEQFSINEGVKEMKEMPIALENHTATTFGKNKMIVCGGICGDEDVS